MLVTANILQPLIDVFEAVIKFFHNSAGIPWGWSIVLLTVVVRAVMIPLTLKQIKSMVRMQQLAPQMKELQSKYKDDKQRQQQEIMKFYKENNVNPLGSCLPLVAQLPVFISLYYMLRQSLRADICPTVQPGYNATLHKVTSLAHTKVCGVGHGASFLFINDLTNKATGATLIALLVLYVGTQLASSMMMSAATTDPMQRRIMMFMPLVFVLVVIRFPAGVLVYWITTNTWTIGQQYIVRRRIGPLQAASATAGAGGGGRSGGSASARSIGSSSGSGSGSSSGGGLGGLLSRARENATAAREPSGGGGNGKAGNGKAAATSDSGGASPSSRAGQRKASGRSGSGSGKPTSSRSGSGSTKGSAQSGNGEHGASGGLSSLIRGKGKQDDAEPVSTGARGGPPPKPPRKKKKRSGRRR